MSGHSKWSTIKHKKGALDAKRGKIFTKILKEITSAARNGSDPSSNPHLRLAIEKSKSNNIPKDNIDKAIKRGTGELEGASYEDYIYEGYGPAGVGLVVEVLTDNRNRTGGEIRHIFTKSGNNMAEAGAVSWNFERKGLIIISNVKEADILEEAMELNVENIEEKDNDCLLYCSLDTFYSTQHILQEKYTIESELTMVAKNSIKIENIEEAELLIALLDKLEDHDDVQKVHGNFYFSDDVISQL